MTYMIFLPDEDSATQQDIEEALRDAGITAYVKSIQDEDGN